MIKLAFVGAGRMASAMVEGVLRKSYYDPTEIACTSAPDGSGESLAQRTGITFCGTVEDLFEHVSRDGDEAFPVIVLAFKPQQLQEIGSRHQRIATGRLLISILAGIRIDKLGAKFGTARNIVRSMPNTPGQIGAGITCFSSESRLDESDRDRVVKILGSMGPVIPLDESFLDAVTAVSGSGPAYLFEFVAALRDGGIAAGLQPAIACQLAVETVLGAARLLSQSGETPEFLRDAVSSPGGTTLAGLEVMRTADFRAIMRNTVLAAKARSIELAEDA